MSAILRTAAVLGTALAMTMPAFAGDIGVYQTTDRKMDFGLATCGDSTDLCVTLLAARGSAATKQTKPLIGTLVVSEAVATGKNVWKGTMQFQGYNLDGTMRLRPGKNFVISGCAYVVICQDITLIPAE